MKAYFQTVVLLFVFILQVHFLNKPTAQVTNDKINYQVRWSSYEIKYNDDYCEFLGSEEINDDHEVGCLAAGDEWVFECLVVTPNANLKTAKSTSGVNSTSHVVNLYENIEKELDVNFDSIDIQIRSWEDDNGVSSGYGAGDDFYGTQTSTQSFTSSRPCVPYVHDYTLPVTTNEARVYATWRYHHGDDFADALTFGSISTNDVKTHSGRADVKSTWADDELGYTNQLDASDHPNLSNHPEVCYKFTLSTCQLIEIENKYVGSSIDLTVVEMGANNSFTYISTTLAGNTFLDYLAAGEYGIIMEGSSTERNYDLRIESKTIPTIVPGNILLFGPSSIPEGTNHPGSLSNDESASDHSYYKWQRKPTYSSQWEDIANSNSATYSLPELNDTYEYRRCALNDCGHSACTDGIEVQALPYNGEVDGYIETPGGQPVSDITVTITNIDTVEGLGLPYSFTKSVSSNNSGYFKLDDFYVGPESANWRLTPHYPDHVFNPDSTMFSLSYNFPDAGPFTFIDESSFSFEGTVYHDFDSNGECGFPGADIYLNGIYKTTTDEYGDYTLSIPQIDDHTVTVDFPDHTFSPAAIAMYIDEDKIDQKFENTKYRTLHLSLLAGCDEFAGVAAIRVTDSLQCIDETFTTTGSGFLSVSLPAKELHIQVTDFTPITSDLSFSAGNVTTFFDAMNIKIDLRNADTVLDLVYHPRPVIEVSGLPDLPSCGFAYPVIEQSTTNLLEFTAYDYPADVLYNGSPACLLDTGSLQIIDYLTTPDENPRDTTLPVINGSAFYVMRPLTASLAPPHTKTINFLLSDEYGNLVSANEEIFIDGTRPRTGTFTTVSPQIPLFVIHDPPGDLSYSQILQNTTIAETFSMSNGYGGGFNFWAKAKTKQSHEIIQSEFWGELGAGITIGRDNLSTTQSILTSSFTQTFGTASNESLASIYQNGDVYVGAAFNILYAVNDIIQFDPNRCEAKLDKKLMISPDSFNTTYIYTHGYIKNELIPNLRENLANGVIDPDSVQFFEDQAAIWEQIIDKNEQSQLKAYYTENYSFDGAAGPSSKTFQTTNVESTSFEWTAYLHESLSGELGLLLGGVGGAAGFETQLRLNWGESSSYSTANTVSTNYILDDNNPGDIISVSVGKDPIYGTPIFRREAASTSCPHEPNTLKRYDAAITVDQPIHTNVDPEDPVTLVFTIFNQSQSEDDLYYLMRFNVESNPDGALINGTPNPVDWVFTNPIPYGGSVQQTVTIERGSGNVYGYENLEFLIYPNCNDFNSVASQKVSVYYNTPCTDVTINTPAEGWIVSDATSNTLPIHLTDYVVANMDALSIQYTPVGSNSWSKAVDVPIGSLNSNSTIGTIVNWNTTYVDDGEYSIRAKIVCGSDVIYTQRISGRIDQTPPIVYGRPSPVDHAYTSVEEEIKLKFDEDISCSSLNNGNLSLYDLLTGNEIAVDIVCAGSEVIVEPLMDLLALSPSMYRLVILDVEDQYGNVNSDSITWEFSGGEYSEYTCDESTIFYVDKSAIYGARNGRSWADAFVDLRQALETACPGSSIYVAEGTYYPWDSVRITNAMGDTIVRLDTIVTDHFNFVWTHSYDIYGGFPVGGGEFSQRNPTIYPTILSGDKSKNALPDAGDAHTILFISDNAESKMDGFIFEFSFADGTDILGYKGAGVFSKGDVKLNNCIFRDLHAPGTTNDGVGGGFYITEASARLSNCLFYHNWTSSKGGAVSVFDADLTLINCTIADNESLLGAGTSVTQGSIDAKNCIISNDLTNDFPNIHMGHTSSVTANYCLFNDTLQAAVSGISNLESTNPEFTDPFNHHYTLNTTSPAIDAGYNPYVPVDITRDLKNDIRFMDNSFSGAPTIDMGAFEFSPCGFLTGVTALYVNATATGANTGVTWVDALHSLSLAIEMCKACHIDSVLVAEGAYKPATNGLASPREASFNIHEGMVLLGGFPAGGSDIAGRDPNNHVTELNGFVDPDTVFHVMTIQNAGDDVHIDGFSLTSGKADMAGLSKTDAGGGLLVLADGVNQECSPTIRNCRFQLNEANNGGGVALIAENKGVTLPIFENCQFSNNVATHKGGGLAGISNHPGTLNFPKFINCLFSDNEANQAGGALYSVADSSGQSIADLTNCTIVKNEVVSGQGGGAYLEGQANGTSTHHYANCVLWANKYQGQFDHQIQLDTNSGVYIKYSIVQDGNAADSLVLAAGIVDQGNNNDDSPDFSDLLLEDYTLKYGSNGIDDGLLSANSSMLALNGSDRVIATGIDRGAFEFDYKFPCGKYGSLQLDEIPITSAEYKAMGEIFSRGAVNLNSNGSVIFNSTNSILLQDGFSVEAGTEFEAKIEDPCID